MKLPKELIRYGIVGTTTNVSGYLIFVFFTTVLNLSPVLTVSIFYPFFLILAFYFNKNWSFRHKGDISKSVVKYLIAYLGCYILNVGALKLFYEYLGYSHLIVQAVAICVLALILFMTQKYWVFNMQGLSISREQPS
ncbi:MAG: GtrA family protein [Desulfobacterales bacterium]|nr:GtrA family protein [Desulfobacterales bacterium]